MASLSVYVSLLLCATCLLIEHVGSHVEHSLVLLISFDGFRHDYIEKAKAAGKHLPNFDLMIAEGTKAKFVTNTFVTKTFPNHFTIATGMYEENHGVVSNILYDPVYKESVTLSDRNHGNEEKWWNNGTTDKAQAPEPIWMTNERVPRMLWTRRSGVYYWPGSEVAYHGERPHHWKPYNGSVTFTQRVDTMVDWFATEEDPINLGLLYFKEPDRTGHNHGPDSPEVMDKIEEMDGVLGHLFKRLEEHHLSDHVNVILTSDHGMVGLSPDRVITLDQHVNTSWYRLFGSSPAFHILPNEGKEEAIYSSLSKVEHLHVYRKQDIPEEYHYKYNRRIMPIFVTADEGWYILENSSMTLQRKGDHGYNNSLASMHPIFLARGPQFRRGFQSGPLLNVDVYPLICKLLVMDPHANDGDLSRIQHLLREHGEEGEEGFFHLDLTLITYMCVFVMCTMVSGICCVAACRTTRYSIHRRRLLMQIPMTGMNGMDSAEDKVHLLSNISEDEEEEIP